MGQVIGCTGSRGRYTEEKPDSFQQVIGTLYNRLGIDSSETFLNPSSRKMLLLEDRDPVKKLFG